MSKNVRPKTLAQRARGGYALVGPISILLLILFPVVLFAPLLTTKIWFYYRNDIVLWRGLCDLYSVDKFLFAVIVVFGILIPVLKMIATILCWYVFDIESVRKYADSLSQLGRLSMLDVMLFAMFIIAFKGVGFGAVEVQYGLYVYTLLILTSLFLNLAVKRALSQISS